MDFYSYGVTQQQSSLSDLDLLAEEVKIKGFSVLRDVLSAEELSVARQKIDEVYKQQEQAVGADKLASINEKDLARCLLAYDEFFLYTIAANPKVLSVIERLMGNYFVLQVQNGIINKPNIAHHQSSWHRDLPYQNFVSSKPLSMNAMFCIDEFSEQNGCTYVIPFSHREEVIPSVPYIEKNKAPLVAPAGSVVIFDSMLFHQAGYNSSDNTRRGINNVYGAPIIKQQIDLPAILKGKYADDPYMNKLLGYASEVPKSDLAFRESRYLKMKDK